MSTAYTVAARHHRIRPATVSGVSHTFILFVAPATNLSIIYFWRYLFGMHVADMCPTLPVSVPAALPIFHNRLIHSEHVATCFFRNVLKRGAVAHTLSCDRNQSHSRGVCWEGCSERSELTVLITTANKPCEFSKAVTSDKWTARLRKKTNVIVAVETATRKHNSCCYTLGI